MLGGQRLLGPSSHLTSSNFYQPVPQHARVQPRMKRTLLLCFIHGFKGGDDTFDRFPEDFRAFLSHALPKVTVYTVTYPQFETRGDLKDCVRRFKEWLQNKVIDLEVANEQPSPTVDPSVRVVLVGHSMGGIVAAETVLSIVQDQPIASTSTSGGPPDNTFMFPYIQGILAFDTPYLGLSPGVVAHGAEGHFNNASAAYQAYSKAASAFGWGAKSDPGPSAVEASKLLPSANASTSVEADAAATPAWQRYGRFAMFAGAAGAVVAGGAAAYMNRDQLTEGWKWVGSHLEFVGCLARGADMEKRLQRVIDLEQSQDFGFLDMFTTLGRGVEGKNSWSSGVLGNQRTFCVLPKPDSQRRKYFEEAQNHMATDETVAHTAMFTPRKNPGYHRMMERARDEIVGWTGSNWYNEATLDEAGLKCGDDAEIVDGPAEVEELDIDFMPKEHAGS